mmetsp:Transcript_14066/g.36387  ORF Transcript_14066/g.36387 Transcript_14066/m.36387 type:complete len:315 (-) Transcript_14066:28-972(-)
MRTPSKAVAIPGSLCSSSRFIDADRASAADTNLTSVSMTMAEAETVLVRSMTSAGAMGALPRRMSAAERCEARFCVNTSRSNSDLPLVIVNDANTVVASAGISISEHTESTTGPSVVTLVRAASASSTPPRPCWSSTISLMSAGLLHVAELQNAGPLSRTAASMALSSAVPVQVAAPSSIVLWSSSRTERTMAARSAVSVHAHSVAASAKANVSLDPDTWLEERLRTVWNTSCEKVRHTSEAQSKGRNDAIANTWSLTSSSISVEPSDVTASSMCGSHMQFTNPGTSLRRNEGKTSVTWSMIVLRMAPVNEQSN